MANYAVDKKRKSYYALLLSSLCWVFLLPILIPINSYATELSEIIQLSKENGWYTDAEIPHLPVDYEELTYQEFDDTSILQSFERLSLAIQTPGMEEDAIAAYDRILAELDLLMTMRSINSLHYYRDVNNSEYSENDYILSEKLVDLADQATSLIQEALLSNNCKKALLEHIDNEATIDLFLSYNALSQDEKDLINLESELVQSYNVASMANYSVSVHGKTWTSESFNKQYQTLSSEEYEQIYLALAKEKNNACAQIFLTLVENRNRQAVLAGYENYAEYAYQEIYGRDYTTEEIQVVYRQVKEQILPLMHQLYGKIMQEDTSKLSQLPSPAEEEIIERVAPLIQEIDPALLVAYQYLKEYHLYDMDYVESKMDIGYTDMLYSYGAPVIFNCPTMTYMDYQTFIHEFGHYNNSFHNAKHALTDIVNTDVAEIHSQGLEILFLEQADKLYGDSSEIVRYHNLYTLCCSIIDGCLFDEFQNIVYRSTQPYTVSELNKLFLKLSEEYGYEYQMAGTEDYIWVDTPHTFQSPFYYISYATSALSAMDIYGLSLQDYEQAVNQYMYLTTYGLDTPYRELMDIVCMTDIFEDGSVEKIIQPIAESLDGSNEVKTDSVNHIIWYFLYGLLFCAAIVIVVLWKKKCQTK